MEKLSILYLDDEPNNLIVFEANFRKQYIIKATTSPTEALQWVIDGLVDVVITDQVMPEMSGSDFLKKVKEINDSVPRILLTGYMASDVDRDLVQYVLGKPWDREVVHQAIAKAVAR